MSAIRIREIKTGVKQDFHKKRTEDLAIKHERIVEVMMTFSLDTIEQFFLCLVKYIVILIL